MVGRLEIIPRIAVERAVRSARRTQRRVERKLDIIAQVVPVGPQSHDLRQAVIRLALCCPSTIRSNNDIAVTSHCDVLAVRDVLTGNTIDAKRRHLRSPHFVADMFYNRNTRGVITCQQVTARGERGVSHHFCTSDSEPTSWWQASVVIEMQAKPPQAFLADESSCSRSPLGRGLLWDF